MTIRFDLITEINDTDFNRLFNDSIDSLNGGTYPWEITPVADGDNEAKRTYLRANFQSHLDADNGVLFTCSEDGYVLTLSAGFVNGTHFLGTMLLVGRNQAGSKSFMYAPEYHAAREEFWDRVNYLTWDFQTLGPGTAFFDHVARVYNDTAVNNPEWIQNARFARGKDGPMAGEIVSEEANNSVIPLYSIQQNQLGNTGLKMVVTEAIAANTDTANTDIFADEPLPYEQYANNEPIFNPPPEE